MVALTLFVGCGESAPSVRNDQVTWYVHRATPLTSFRPRSTFVTFSAAGTLPTRARPLDDLDGPDSFVAAHLLLAYTAPLPGPPGDFTADSAHREMAVRLHDKGLVTLEDQPDGTCVANVDGLRVVLRPAGRKGSYFGQGRTTHTIYTATADVDPEQRRSIREQWQRRIAG